MTFYDKFAEFLLERERYKFLKLKIKMEYPSGSSFLKFLKKIEDLDWLDFELIAYTENELINLKIRDFLLERLYSGKIINIKDEVRIISKEEYEFIRNHPAIKA